MTESIAYQCHAAIVSTIQALSLTGIQSAEIRIQKALRDRASIRRGIAVVPQRAIEAPGTNERDDIGHAVLVVFVQGTGNGYSDDLTRIETWRQSVRRAFHNKRLSGVTESIGCSVSQGDPYMPKELQDQNDVSSLMIRCWTRETRN